MATTTVSPTPIQSFFSTHQEDKYTWPASSPMPKTMPAISFRVVHHEIPPSDNEKRDTFTNILNLNNDARSEKGESPASRSAVRPPLLSILQEGLEQNRLEYQSAITAKPTHPYQPAFTPSVSVIALQPLVLGITPILAPHVPRKEKGSIDVPKTGHWWLSGWGQAIWANMLKKEPDVKEWYKKNRDELDTIQKWKDVKEEAARVISEISKTSTKSKHGSVLQKTKDFKLKVPGFKRDTSALDEKQIFDEILRELGFAGTIEEFRKDFAVMKEAEKEKFFELVVEKLGSSATQPGPVVISGPIPSAIQEKLVLQENYDLTVSAVTPNATGNSLDISKRDKMLTITDSPTLTGFYTHTRPIHTYWFESIETSLETWATFPSITLVRTNIQTASYLRITDVIVLTTTTTITPSPTPSARTLTSTSHISDWTTITVARPIPMPTTNIPIDRLKDTNTDKAQDHTLRNVGISIGVTVGVALLILMLVFAVKKCKSGNAKKIKAASDRSNTDIEEYVSGFFNMPLQDFNPSNRSRR